MSSLYLLTLFLLVGAVQDFRLGTVNNSLTYGNIALGLCVSACTQLISVWPSIGTIPLAEAAVGGAVCMAVSLFAYLLGGLGGGDVKLMGGVGVFLGSTQGMLLLAIGLVLSACSMLVIQILREFVPRLSTRASKGLPFAPMLFLAALVMYWDILK